MVRDNADKAIGGQGNSRQYSIEFVPKKEYNIKGFGGILWNI